LSYSQRYVRRRSIDAWPDEALQIVLEGVGVGRPEVDRFKGSDKSALVAAKWDVELDKCIGGSSAENRASKVLNGLADEWRSCEADDWDSIEVTARDVFGERAAVETPEVFSAVEVTVDGLKAIVLAGNKSIEVALNEGIGGQLWLLRSVSQVAQSISGEEQRLFSTQHRLQSSVHWDQLRESQQDSSADADWTAVRTGASAPGQVAERDNCLVRVSGPRTITDTG
jgi:hypothetical protein